MSNQVAPVAVFRRGQHAPASVGDTLLEQCKEKRERESGSTTRNGSLLNDRHVCPIRELCLTSLNIFCALRCDMMGAFRMMGTH